MLDLTTDLTVIAFQITGFVLAPLLFGLINRTKASFAGRSGPHLLQTYFDLWKLLRKGAVYSATTTPLFRAGPIVNLAATGCAMLLLPSFGSGALLSFPGDFIALVGLLALARFFMVVAALDTGSSFEGMGASREVTLAALGEPALFLVLAVLVIITGSVSLAGMLDYGFIQSWGGGTGPAVALALAALILVLLVENARIPVDDPNTHLELTMIHEVMVLDHSGPDLAYLGYAATLKLWIFSAILVAITLPTHTGILWADATVFACGMFGAALLVGVIESAMARLRMSEIPQMITIALALASMSAAIALVAR
jgi:formate hydrogenlyase subunit 4